MNSHVWAPLCLQVIGFWKRNCCVRAGPILILLASAKLSSKRLNPFRFLLVIYQTLKQQSPRLAGSQVSWQVALSWQGPISSLEEPSGVVETASSVAVCGADSSCRWVM